jgi:hypothetical protein
MECTKCHQEKAMSEFYTNKHTKAGYFSQCKRCHNGNGLDWSKMTQAEKDKKTKELQKVATLYCARHPNAKEQLIKWIADGILMSREGNWDRIEQNCSSI